MARTKAKNEFRIYDTYGSMDVSESYDSVEDAVKAAEDYDFGEYAEGEEVVILQVVKKGYIASRQTIVDWEK